MERLRWKKDPCEKGLASIGAGPRGSTYHDGENEYAMVFAIGGGWRGPVTGWAWAANGDGIPVRNTAHSPCETEAEAKKQAAAYVRECLSNGN